MTEEVASAFDNGRHYAAEEITVSFDADRCRHFAECVTGLPEVFDVDRRPWIDPSGAPARRVAEVVRRCPSGALQYRQGDGAGEPAAAVTSVVQLPNGQIQLRGHLAVQTPDELRSETRMIACGCGSSTAAPYCDGTCNEPSTTRSSQ
jgi:uncharacterized Fe-S cluster protein YjdI